MKNEYLSTAYKGVNINVIYEECPTNPFEDWDGLSPLLTEGGHRFISKDYSDGAILNYLRNYLSENQIIRNQKRIVELLDIPCFYDEVFESKDEKLDYLFVEIESFLNDSIANMEKFCIEFKIKHYCNWSRGNSQGDAIECFLCWTPEYEKVTGISYKDFKVETLESSFEIFGYFAWGEVYMIECEEVDFYVGGYYGDDSVADGIEEAKNLIDERVKEETKKYLQKVKELSRNNVPLAYREEQLTNLKQGFLTVTKDSI